MGSSDPTIHTPIYVSERSHPFKIYSNMATTETVFFYPQPPETAIAHGTQMGANEGKKLYSVIAHTEFGDIPGKVHEGEDICWFPYKGKEIQEQNFSWVVSDKPTRLVMAAGNSDIPSNALKLGFQKDLEMPAYCIIANTENGLIPGKAFDAQCAWVPLHGETATADFFWIVVDE